MFVVVMVGTSSSSSRGIERVVSRDVWMELFWRYGFSERKNWGKMGGPTLPVQNPRSTCSGETKECSSNDASADPRPGRRCFGCVQGV